MIINAMRAGLLHQSTVPDVTLRDCSAGVPKSWGNAICKLRVGAGRSGLVQCCYRPYRGVTADRQHKAVRSMAIQGVAKALTRQIRATGDRLYKKDDARARHNGWTIETRR